MTNCFKTDPNLNLFIELEEPDFLFQHLDQIEFINFFDYIFLRRINLAMDSCGQETSLEPVNL